MRKLSVLLTVVILVTMVSAVSAAQKPLPNIGGQMGGAVGDPKVTYIAGSLWTNGIWDHQAFMAAEEIYTPNWSTLMWYAYTLDDFEVGAAQSPAQINEIRAVLVTNDPDPIFARAEIWGDCGLVPAGNPAYPCGPSWVEKTETISTTRYKIGYWVEPGGNTLGVWEWHFYPKDNNGNPIVLPAARYWLKVVGMTNNPNVRFYWASSGMGTIQLQPGYFQSDHFEFYCPDWYTSLYVMDYMTDFAFDVDATFPGSQIHVSDITHHTAPRLFPPSWEIENTATVVDDLTGNGVPGAYVTGYLYWVKSTPPPPYSPLPPPPWVNPNAILLYQGSATKPTDGNGIAYFHFNTYHDGYYIFCIGKDVYDNVLTPTAVDAGSFGYNYTMNKCYVPCAEVTCIQWDSTCDCDGGDACGF